MAVQPMTDERVVRVCVAWIVISIATILTACSLAAYGAGTYGSAPKDTVYSVSIVINPSSTTNTMPQIWSKCLGRRYSITTDSTMWDVHCHH